MYRIGVKLLLLLIFVEDIVFPAIHLVHCQIFTVDGPGKILRLQPPDKRCVDPGQGLK